MARKANEIVDGNVNLTKLDASEMTALRLNTEHGKYCILGLTPMIYNSMSFHAKTSLLYPRAGKMNDAEKAANIKHDPLAEFRASLYRHDYEGSAKGAPPTRLYFPSSGFKKTISNAALDMPGMKKAQVGRLTWIDGDKIDIFGVPQLLMSVVTSAGISKAPDIRTRGILPQWACRVTVTWVKPLIKGQQIDTLFAAGGMLSGIGDYRQGKGGASYGQFEIVNDDDPRFLAVTKLGYAAQNTAIADPACYDKESQELLSWFVEERDRRGDGNRRRRVSPLNGDAAHV